MSNYRIGQLLQSHRLFPLRCGAVLGVLIFSGFESLPQIPNQGPIRRLERRTPVPRPLAEPQRVENVGEVDSEIEMRVLRVRNAAGSKGDRGCKVGLNDEIWIDVKNLPAWISDANKRARVTREIRELVPYFNGNPMTGVNPTQVKYDEADEEIAHLRFKLVRNKDSSEAWSRIWKNPRFERRMGVSVGFPTGEEMPTLVLAEATDPQHLFDMRIVRKARFWSGISILLLSLVVFIWLARKTEIIRDTTGEKRPDNNWPYSLARTQMAFWFFLVSASFFFLWVLTGSMNTLTSSVLALIGISAGTAVGAALIDASKPSMSKASGDFPAVNLNRPRSEIVVELENAIAQKKAALEQAKGARADAPDQPALAQNEAEVKRLTETIKHLESQKGYFSYPAWRGVMNDLLSDDNVITFHRFQIFVWTLLLGIIFIIHVYNDLAMPDFDGTLLGLLGISAGTYVGFKLPENKRAQATSANPAG